MILCLMEHWTVFNSTDYENAETKNYIQRSWKLPHTPLNISTHTLQYTFLSFKMKNQRKGRIGFLSSLCLIHKTPFYFLSFFFKRRKLEHTHFKICTNRLQYTSLSLKWKKIQEQGNWFFLLFFLKKKKTLKIEG